MECEISDNQTWDELLLRFPGIIVSDTTARGSVKLKGKWYYLRIHCPHFPLLQNVHVEVQQPHQQKMVSVSTACLQPNCTLHDLIAQLPELLNAQLSDTNNDNPSNEQTPEPTSPTNIYAEIAALYAPHAYQIQLNEACSRIRFQHFAEHEQHYFELELPTLCVRSHSLPDCIAWQELLPKYKTLSALLHQFHKYLEDLREFYENLADIDELCYVVQPAPPVSTKHNWRMFVLRERVFLKLVLADPFAPIASMSVQIIGPTQEVEQLRRTYSEGLRDWDPDIDIQKNLLRIFDLCFFPMPPGIGALCADSDKGDLSQIQFCNICYSYQLEQGEIPIVSCDNTHCSLIFHASCLKEWFNTLTHGKDFLRVSFGACPFCKTKISASFAELLES